MEEAETARDKTSSTMKLDTNQIKLSTCKTFSITNEAKSFIEELAKGLQSDEVLKANT